MVSINQLPLTWSTIMYDATLARMGHGKYVGARGEPRRDGVCVLRKQTPYALVEYIESSFQVLNVPLKVLRAQQRLLLLSSKELRA